MAAPIRVEVVTVGVTGGSGSGKTTLATNLTHHFHDPSSCLLHSAAAHDSGDDSHGLICSIAPLLPIAMDQFFDEDACEDLQTWESPTCLRSAAFCSAVEHIRCDILRKSQCISASLEPLPAVAAKDPNAAAPHVAYFFQELRRALRCDPLYESYLYEADCESGANSLHHSKAAMSSPPTALAVGDGVAPVAPAAEVVSLDPHPLQSPNDSFEDRERFDLAARQGQPVPGSRSIDTPYRSSVKGSAEPVALPLVPPQVTVPCATQQGQPVTIRVVLVLEGFLLFCFPQVVALCDRFVFCVVRDAEVACMRRFMRGPRRKMRVDIAHRIRAMLGYRQRMHSIAAYREGAPSASEVVDPAPAAMEPVVRVRVTLRDGATASGHEQRHLELLQLAWNAGLPTAVWSQPPIQEPPPRPETATDEDGATYYDFWHRAPVAAWAAFSRRREAYVRDQLRSRAEATPTGEVAAVFHNYAIYRYWFFYEVWEHYLAFWPLQVHLVRRVVERHGITPVATGSVWCQLLGAIGPATTHDAYDLPASACCDTGCASGRCDTPPQPRAGPAPSVDGSSHVKLVCFPGDLGPTLPDAAESQPTAAAVVLEEMYRWLSRGV